MTHAAQFPTKDRASGAFTLVELLAVMAIIAILSSVMFSSIASVTGANALTNAAGEIQGVLEQARTRAMAGGTYTWVGFFEEDPTVPATTPQAKGVGQLVMAVMASNDGSDLGTSLISTGGSSSQLPSSSLAQVTQLLKIPYLHIDTTISNSGAITFPAMAGSITPYEVDPTAANAAGTTVSFPLSGTAKYNFSQIIQFSPQGDASEIYSSPTQAIDIGLRSAHGDTPVATGSASKNVVVIRVQGIGGKVTIYRP